MSFTLIANLVLILAVLGVVVLFLRRLPEVVEKDKGGVESETEKQPFLKKASRVCKALSKKAWKHIKNGTIFVSKKIWHFMLEAKDLKQSQILANRVARFVRPGDRTVNIGMYSSLKKADRLISEGNFEEAEETLIQVIRKNPQEYLAYEGLMKIYIKQKKHDNAIEILEFLVKHNPQNDNYFAYLGNALLSTRRFSEAAEAYTKSLELNDLIPARFVNLGLSLQGAGKSEEAKPNFEKAVELEPGNMQYLLILIDSMVTLGEKQEALEKLKSVFEKHPEEVSLKEKIQQMEHLG
ncbi:MAG: tetratricopeptide repeat protein [Candidatus Doudnabacteria bacterium]